MPVFVPAYVDYDPSRSLVGVVMETGVIYNPQQAAFAFRECPERRNRMSGRAFAIISLLSLVACNASTEQSDEAAKAKVSTTGKEQTALANVPKEVLDAARAAQPTMKLAEAEAEVRDGRNYYDVAGTLPDGSEIELDLMQGPKGWSVVETQRDIAFASAPEKVRATSAKVDAQFAPERVIESRQADGIVIYELFGPKPQQGEPRKVEIKYDGSTAELLTKEWAH
jgi:hypothetical protein